jgi:hypothetical protein
MTLVRCGAIFANGSISALFSTCALTATAARWTGCACAKAAWGTAVIPPDRWKFA